MTQVKRRHSLRAQEQSQVRVGHLDQERLGSLGLGQLPLSKAA